MPKVVLTIAGLGAVASIVIGSGQAFTLNQNSALVSGSLYEFEVHVPGAFPGISVTGATLLWTTIIVDD